ncbi:hypothetical protein BaRGS_00030637 [Batillaria attramentaria]|uniref:Uncharacterized protein n=1 Tax=Batillaria attramentaria TaxID=370345 RepID=A0ABD0JSW6_9CAEN
MSIKQATLDTAITTNEAATSNTQRSTVVQGRTAGLEACTIGISLTVVYLLLMGHFRLRSALHPMHIELAPKTVSDTSSRPVSLPC